MSPITPAPRRSGGPILSGLLLATAAVGLAACGSLESDDQRAARLTASRTALVGADVSPINEYPDPESSDRPGMSSKTLATENPAADELSYKPADPGRDVEDRLRMFTAESMAPSASGEGPLVITLAEAFGISQRTGREYINAEEDYILAAIRLLIERHQWEPQLTNDTTALLTGQGTDGDYQNAVSVINDLRVTQRLPYGGQAEAAWVWRATENLREQAGGRYRQSSTLVFDASIPLLRGAGLVAQESLIQAERDLIYQARNFESFRRDYLVDIAKDYFGLLQSEAQIANQKRRLQSLRQIEASIAAQVESGRKNQFELGIAQNDVLSSVSSLAGARDSYIAQLDAFKIKLGIPVERPVVIRNLIFELAEPDISLADATQRALEYRLDLQNQRDRLDDARRSVKNARNDLLPDLNANGGVGFPTDPDAREGGLEFSRGDINYTAGITFGLPLDREAERLRLRASQISLGQQEREFSRFEDSLILDVRSRVRAIDLARFQLRLAETQVTINERRQLQQTIQADRTTSQERVDSENALVDARNARDTAQTNLRSAVLDYLLATGQMRVGRDGIILPLPGMEVVPVTLFEDVDGLSDWYLDPPPLEANNDPDAALDEALENDLENGPPPANDEPIEDQIEGGDEPMGPDEPGDGPGDAPVPPVPPR